MIRDMEELREKHKRAQTLWTWQEAVKRLAITESEQLLLCALWNPECPWKTEADKETFLSLWVGLQEKETNPVTLPEWIYEEEGKVVLSPILEAWLNEEVPRLPKGAGLSFPKRERTYGLDSFLVEGNKLLEQVEKEEGPAILCLSGEPGSGRSFAMEQLCASNELSLLWMDGDSFAGSERQLNACLMAARLYDAFLCVKLGKEIRGDLLEQLSQCVSVFGIVKEDGRKLTERPDQVVYTRRILPPDGALKTTIAKDILGEQIESLPSNLPLSQITGRQLPLGDYIRFLKQLSGELKRGALCLEQLQTVPLSSSLQWLPATRTFAELKLPASQYQQLENISRMIAARQEVMTSWGFGEKFPYGNGMSILFYGAPGTGKTMAAQVLANRLGMPLFRVDLSQLISKYIGETQKNIGKIFDEAEKYECILLFDEADAIFAKRSDVSDAQDRYSNAETAYLLQRIEQYAGVSILATNLLQNFDEAFRRRISYMVHFPMPDATLRHQLWETIFPKETPVSPQVDTAMLAQAFELSGAAIKNAALHGALLAAAEGKDVQMKHLLDGISNEYGKQGKSFSSSQKELMEAYQ